MNWYRSPELVDRLAAEYALGTLTGGARRRFEAVMQAHPDVARAATRWGARFVPLDAGVKAATVDARLWPRIEGRLFGAPVTQAWWRRLFGPAPAAALAFGLVLGVGLPLVRTTSDDDGPQLPESYVGVLATADGKPGLIVASRRQGRTLDLKVLQATAVPDGRTAVLWILDAQGRASAVAPLPAPAAGFRSVSLDRPSEALFASAVELAVSIETAGALPAAPSGPFVYRGLCGKLWPPKPPR